MNNKEFVINRFPDARIVYGSSGKPSVMSDIFVYASKKGADINEAWDNAANDIKSLNFPKRYFNDEETVKYFYPNAHAVNLKDNEWIVSTMGMTHTSVSLITAWSDAAKHCKDNYEFWSKKKWNDA